MRRFCSTVSAGLVLLVAGVGQTPAGLARMRRETRWAILVGIDAYENPRIPRLRSCVNDVRLMHKALVTCCGFQPDRICILGTGKNGSGVQPTRRNILERLHSILSGAKEDDLVLVYFSGHGTQIPDGVGRRQGVFCAKDFNPACEVGHVSYAEVNRRLAVCKARVKLLIVDAAHAGSAIETRRDRRLAVLASCGANQTSVEGRFEQDGQKTRL